MTGPQKFRSRTNPQHTVEAMRLDADDEHSAAKITGWMAGHGFHGFRVLTDNSGRVTGLAVGPGLTHGKEADIAYLQPGDWAVRLSSGEFYGFGEATFLGRYEPTQGPAMTETLFDLDHPPPTRKGSRDYLTAVLTDAYDGHPAWALAPIDTYVRALHKGDTEATDFVWLIIDARLIWALVDLHAHTIIALNPRRIDQSIWHHDEPEPPEPGWRYDAAGNRLVWTTP